MLELKKYLEKRLNLGKSTCDLCGKVIYIKEFNKRQELKNVRICGGCQ